MKQDLNPAARKVLKRLKYPLDVTLDGSGANRAAIEANNAGLKRPIKVRQTKYLNDKVSVRVAMSTPPMRRASQDLW